MVKNGRLHVVASAGLLCHRHHQNEVETIDASVYWHARPGRRHALNRKMNAFINTQTWVYAYKLVNPRRAHAVKTWRNSCKKARSNAPKSAYINIDLLLLLLLLLQRAHSSRGRVSASFKARRNRGDGWVRGIHEPLSLCMRWAVYWRNLLERLHRRTWGNQRTLT
jgi:hypothetical protein